MICQETAGHLTSPEELARLRDLADRGVSTWVDARESLRADAEKVWAWGSPSGTFTTTLRDGQKVCRPVSDPDAVDMLKEGAPDAYAKVLASLIGTGSTVVDARLAKEARKHVLDWVDTNGFGGLGGADWSADNQCILELAISMPIWIETALLLESTRFWVAADHVAFATWLAREVYPKVAWASRVRRNNWGAAGSLAASAIARYADGWLASVSEAAPQKLTQSPADAWQQHDDVQLERIHTEWRGDSQCSRYGIQSHGGIPDELRRGAGGCDASFIPSATDAALAYQTMHVELLIYHAEMLRREGDMSFYEARTAGGMPALLQSILFVIDNPTRSWSWGSRSGALAVAEAVYRDARLSTELRKKSTFRGGRTLPYGAITATP